MTHVALISGVAGQDGSYLADFLLSKNYQVWGIVRQSSAAKKVQNINHLIKDPNVTLRYGDMTDGNVLTNILREIQDKYNNLERLEVYNLAALSHVGLSFELPEYCGNVNALGVLRFLEAIRVSRYCDKIRFYQASTSELFGKVIEVPQTEKTPFYPRSPYGVAKLYGFWTTKNYRESYNMYACNGILFNHESERRDEIFVTRKITKGLSDIIHGRSDKLILGNINSFRDWGHAKDYVRGMWMILQQDQPDDFILCTNECHMIREFIEKAFGLQGFDIKWKGEGINEIGYDFKTGRELIFISEEFFRPSEVDLLKGDCSKAIEKFGWKPEYSFDDLIQEMVAFDCKI